MVVLPITAAVSRKCPFLLDFVAGGVAQGGAADRCAGVFITMAEAFCNSLVEPDFLNPTEVLPLHTSDTTQCSW